MSIPDFDPTRSAVIRAGLARRAEDLRNDRRMTRRAWLGRATFGVVGLAAGLAVSGAAWAGGLIAAPTPAVSESSAIAGPDGVVPGAPVITMLGDPGSAATDGSDAVDLSVHPAAATHVRVWITCLTGGTIFWGLDEAGNNPSVECSTADVGSVTWYDFDLANGTTLYINATSGVKSAITYQFEHQRATEWGVNASGQTYGAVTDQGEPDLVAVVGTAEDGTMIEGYALGTQLAFGPLPEPANPEEALEYMEDLDELRAQYPAGYPVPVYESDGQTQIGWFYIAL